MVEHQPSKLDTWVRFPSPAFFLLYRTAHGGPSPSGKAQDFDSCIRRFESGRPSFRRRIWRKGKHCFPIYMVGMAQLASAPDCGSGGRGFESHYPP